MEPTEAASAVPLGAPTPGELQTRASQGSPRGLSGSPAPFLRAGADSHLPKQTGAPVSTGSSGRNSSARTDARPVCSSSRHTRWARVREEPVVWAKHLLSSTRLRHWGTASFPLPSSCFFLVASTEPWWRPLSPGGILVTSRCGGLQGMKDTAEKGGDGQRGG